LMNIRSARLRLFRRIGSAAGDTHRCRMSVDFREKRVKTHNICG
jgi:hypothetical protein